MNYEKSLKKKIQNYLLTPIFISVILVLMCIILYFVDHKSAVITSVIVGLYLIAQFVMYLMSKTSIMPVLFRFAMEQGQVQKELLKELAVPYALLDTDGKILWGNNLFIEKLGDGSKKRIRKNIISFFPIMGVEVLNSEEEKTLDVEYGDTKYNALIKKIKFLSLIHI